MATYIELETLMPLSALQPGCSTETKHLAIGLNILSNQGEWELSGSCSMWFPPFSSAAYHSFPFPHLQS